MRRLAAVVVGMLVLALAVPMPASAEGGLPANGAPLPANSGEGRRAVYAVDAQHVWLVEADGTVVRDYNVSGHKGYPKAGTYAVWSRSEVSRAGSLRLNNMVRFARSRRKAVGFHQIPLRRNGVPIQSDAALGHFRSHGCVRESAADAAAMWDFGQMGTTVVVLP
jgi:hypothetical protein